jgi:hypothetical protein
MQKTIAVTKNADQILMESLLGRPRRRWEGNIKMDLGSKPADARSAEQ